MFRCQIQIPTLRELLLYALLIGLLCLASTAKEKKVYKHFEIQPPKDWVSQEKNFSPFHYEYRKNGQFGLFFIVTESDSIPQAKERQETVEQIVEAIRQNWGVVLQPERPRGFRFKKQQGYRFRLNGGDDPIEGQFLYIQGSCNRYAQVVMVYPEGDHPASKAAKRSLKTFEFKSKP